MKLTIVSPERVLYRGEAQSVTVPGARGQFVVLDNHAPIISTLQAGTLSYKAETTEVIEIQGGFIDVANNEVSVCVEV